MQDTQSKVRESTGKHKYWQASASSPSSKFMIKYISSYHILHHLQFQLLPTPSIRCCPETTKPWVKEPGSTTCFVQPSFENGWQTTRRAQPLWLCPKKKREHLPFRNTPPKNETRVQPQKTMRGFGFAYVWPGLIFLFTKNLWFLALSH